METILLIIHLIIALALVGVILLQKSEGGALGIGGSGGGVSGMFSVRGSANLLTRTTAILAILFIITSLSLAVVSGRYEGDRQGGITEQLQELPDGEAGEQDSSDGEPLVPFSQ